jgi:hypothetical protein
VVIVAGGGLDDTEAGAAGGVGAGAVTKNVAIALTDGREASATTR